MSCFTSLKMLLELTSKILFCVFNRYGLLEDYANGAGLSEDVEDMSQDSVNGAGELNASFQII